MKKLIAIAMAFGLLLVPYTIYGQTDQQASKPPPVAAPLVREGDFAMKLVGALNLGTAGNEAEAESILLAVGISPRNGWISDYPVTPDVLVEIETAVGNAADDSKLPTGRNEALKVFRTAAVELGLPITVEVPGRYAEGAPPTYTEPAGLDEYYAEQGPPVVTYYPPPPDYGYLYAWVPSPFWCTGFFFPGFFVLNDFDVVVVDHHHHHHKFTNHFFDPKTKTVARIDPVTRTERAFTGSSRPHGGFDSAEARRGAQSIFQRSYDRTTSPRGVNNAGSGRAFSGRVNGGSHEASVAHGGSFGHVESFGGFHSGGGFHGGGFRGR